MMSDDIITGAALILSLVTWVTIAIVAGRD